MRLTLLPPEAKTPQASWLTFAKVKGCAKEVGAALDSTLQNNDVIVPSTLGLDMREDRGRRAHIPAEVRGTCERGFPSGVRAERRCGETLLAWTGPGLGRVRIVLTDEQHEVLRRMKRVRRVKGELKETAEAGSGAGL